MPDSDPWLPSQDRSQASARGVLAINRLDRAEARHRRACTFRGVWLRPSRAHRQRRRSRPMPDSDPWLPSQDRSQASARGVLAINRLDRAEARHLRTFRGVWLRPSLANRQRKRSRPMPDSDPRLPSPDRSQASARGVLAINRLDLAEARHLRACTFRGVWLRPILADRQRRRSPPMPDSDPRLPSRIGSIGRHFGRGRRTCGCTAASVPVRSSLTACATASATLRASCCTGRSRSSVSWLVA